MSMVRIVKLSGRSRTSAYPFPGERIPACLGQHDPRGRPEMRAAVIEKVDIAAAGRVER